MRKPIIVGEKIYKTKKELTEHYRKILNSYKFGEFLNDNDYNDIIDLLDYENTNNSDIQNATEDNVENKLDFDDETNISEEFFIENIRIKKVQFNAKCFEIVYNDNSSEIMSYLMIINNRKYNPESLFNVACRNVINKDLRAVKKEYFDNNSIKGFVKCQETNILSKWTELVVDHRQPNTFSIIVDRFKEIKQLKLDEIEYETTDENFIVFKNTKLQKEFEEYHKQKANLRIVRKECNLSRTGLARIKKSSKDLTIK